MSVDLFFSSQPVRFQFVHINDFVKQEKRFCRLFPDLSYCSVFMQSQKYPTLHGYDLFTSVCHLQQKVIQHLLEVLKSGKIITLRLNYFSQQKLVLKVGKRPLIRVNGKNHKDIFVLILFPMDHKTKYMKRSNISS